jgi:hypothetical protein
VKLKLDENLPAELLDHLRAGGHDVMSVDEEGLAGSDDAALLEHVRGEDRAILTMDKGIANVQVYPPEYNAGIVLFRPPSAGRGAVFAFVKRHLPQVLDHDLSGRLLVVTEGGIRQR